jgi:hypothetical protein
MFRDSYRFHDRFEVRSHLRVLLKHMIPGAGVELYSPAVRTRRGAQRLANRARSLVEALKALIIAFSAPDSRAGIIPSWRANSIAS